MNDVETDIEESKTHKSAEVKMIDGKVSACFRREEMGTMDMLKYDKIFDTWKDFTKYAEEFFNLET